MTLNEREKAVVLAVFTDLWQRFTDEELNYFIGSETIREMHALRSKLYHEDYCDRHHIRYEDMTEIDFENAALERAERDGYAI